MSRSYNTRYSNHLKAKHQKRCGYLLGLLAFFLFIFMIVNLSLAIVTQYSEQKTSYWIIFTVSTIVFCALCIITGYQCYSGREKQLVENTYKTNLNFIQRNILEAQINSTSQLNAY